MSFEIDEYLRHQIMLSRLETGGINAVVLPSLNLTMREIAKLLSESESIRNKPHLESIITRINTLVESLGGWDELEKNHLQEFAQFEADWYSNYIGESIEESLTTPSAELLALQTREALLTVGTASSQITNTWSAFVADNLNNRKKQYDSIVRRGFARGQTIGQMTTEMRRVTKGLLRREAETLARTGYIHYGAQADKAVAIENSDVLDEWYYVVTFDSRTTKTCRSLAMRYNPLNKRLSIDDPRAPEPPLHFNCRTRRIAVPKGTEPEGKRGAVGGESGSDENYDRGQISAKTTQQSWLKRQPKWFVNESLGKKRADLFLKGGLTLDKFTDMSLRPLTLDEIKQKYSTQWRKAFGDDKK